MKKILFFVCTMLTWLSTDATAKTLVVYYSNRASLIEDWLKTLNFAEQATAIRSLSPNPSPKGEGNYYSLNGVKVSNPSKGIYIQNGNKVVIK